MCVFVKVARTYHMLCDLCVSCKAITWQHFPGHRSQEKAVNLIISWGQWCALCISSSLVDSSAERKIVILARFSAKLFGLFLPFRCFSSLYVSNLLINY